MFQQSLKMAFFGLISFGLCSAVGAAASPAVPSDEAVASSPPPVSLAWSGNAKDSKKKKGAAKGSSSKQGSKHHSGKSASGKSGGGNNFAQKYGSTGSKFIPDSKLPQTGPSAKNAQLPSSRNNATRGKKGTGRLPGIGTPHKTPADNGEQR